MATFIRPVLSIETDHLAVDLLQSVEEFCTRNQFAVALAAVLLVASSGYADILSTSASVRPENSLLVDIQVTAGGARGAVCCHLPNAGVDPLVSRLTPVPPRPDHDHYRRLRGKPHVHRARHRRPRRSGGTARGSFTTGLLPAPLLSNTYTLRGRTTAPLVILPDGQTNFQGYVALDLHSADAPQIVWYYSNPPSKASGVLQVDSVAAIVREQNGNFLIADGGSGPPPLAADCSTASSHPTVPCLPRARPPAA
jgi:hypothetical protein